MDWVELNEVVAVCSAHWLSQIGRMYWLWLNSNEDV